MLQNFTKIGMTDIAFLVVNSKKERSQLMLPKLEAKVSFPVYQDTSDEEIWNVLGGGKDDMFIYDRCGRLVAYIPFPLSNLDSEHSFVLNLMLYAYHKDPCSNEISCDEIENNTSTEDFGNQNYTYFSNDTYGGNYEQDNLTTITDEIFSGGFENHTLPDINETISNRNNNTHYQDYDFSDSKEQHNNIFQNSHNSIWKLSGLSENNTADTTFSSFSTPVPPVEKINTICNDTGNCKTETNDVNELQIKSPEITEKAEPSQKRICLAEDEKVCGEWSKRQLKRIKKCCTSTHSRENTCKSFQKRKCKKLKTVIKCCLKVDAPEENNDNTDPDESPGKQKITDSSDSKHHTHENEHHSDSEIQNLP